MAPQARVLCVDDEPRNLKLLEAILAPAGYELVLAESGEQALALIGQRAPDLVLLDIMMPGLSGYDVLSKIRAGENSRLIPVVMVTALREVEDRVKALDLGCDDFISKPFDKVEMLARVKSLLRISYYRNQLDEKEKFESLLNQIEDVIVVLNGDLQPVKYNRPARELLQLGPQAASSGIVGALSDHFKVDYRGDLSHDLKAQPRVFDVTREELATARELILEIKSSVFKGPSGELSNVILLGRDVTAIREEERVKQNFFDLVSHKLMTPITIIASQGELFNLGTYGQLSDDQKKAVEVIYKQVLALKRLVIKLFAFITLDQKNLDSAKAEIGLAGQLPEIIDPLVKSSGKKVETSIDCPPDLKLSMNRSYFDAMIGNLVENAVKFGDKEPVKIAVSALRGPQGLRIKVTDNGPGIPPEEQGKIFQGFYQVEKSFTGQVEGAGLGLALVKRIVELSGGKIGVESALGQGTTFIIDLPGN